ncbi:lipid transport [Trichomonas vaginalis G3]|nr:lipid transport [Trichomonas vaginalis G3]KAI5526939.1 lipid transport [Trichomonas vaginalis G3]
MNNWCVDGVIPLTKEEIEAERVENKKLMKQFTKNILKCDYSNMSVPCSYSEPRSFLERMADFFSFLAGEYLDKAAAATDPEERLKLITISIVSSLHLYHQTKKPWNPVLGETYVCNYGSGAILYGEQVSHHPPISNFELFGKNGSWKVHGQCNFVVDSSMNHFEVKQNGIFECVFPDEDKYQWEFPNTYVHGLQHGDRFIRVVGKIVVKNLEKGLKSVIRLAPKKDKKLGISEFAYSYIYGGIKKIRGKKEKKTDFTKVYRGDYCKQLTLDGQVIWDINNDRAKRPHQDIADEYLLPADSRFRFDRAYLIDKKPMDDADLMKKTIEDAQRREEKLRICVKK